MFTPREDLLQYVWRTKRLPLTDLRTTDGQPLTILSFGNYNQHAGPDFLEARLRIGDTEWAGSVEMHVRASDWYKHGHTTNAAYANVILHVVWEADADVRLPGQPPLACLVLQPYMAAPVVAQYHALMHTEQWIPCAQWTAAVSAMTWEFWLDRLLVERLQAKTLLIENILTTTHYDWNEVFLRWLARGLGGTLHADAMQQVVASLSYALLVKHSDQLLPLEALLFGQAGLLPADPTDAYAKQLCKEYAFLRHKYNLQPPVVSWQFMRLRPSNFPTIRLAQLANLLHTARGWWRSCLEAADAKALANLLQATVSPYWELHYTFGVPSGARSKTLGKQMQELLLINTVAPMLFLYGKYKQEDVYQERAIALLTALPAERNHILTQWQRLGVKAAHSADSQALLQLYKNYCLPKKCLQCAVGNAILQKAT